MDEPDFALSSETHEWKKFNISCFDLSNYIANTYFLNVLSEKELDGKYKLFKSKT